MQAARNGLVDAERTGQTMAKGASGSKGVCGILSKTELTVSPLLPPIAVDPLASARAAGLRYTLDDRPGIRRIRSGKGFRYVDAGGKVIRDPEVLARIRSLTLPPAWTNVWICPLANGHLQATGLDAKGRKQYRYHPRWRSVRDETKYHRTIAFGLALPRIRAQVERDLAQPGLPRSKVLATVIRLLETTHIRVGNEEYARTNGSFGLTTLRNKHVRVMGSTLRFTFRGKSGVRHAIDLEDRRLARIIRQCQDLPGHDLFEYLDEGTVRAVGSADVNEYLRACAGEEFTAKDFRTWAGTVLAVRALQECAACTSLTQARHNVVQAIETVARQLGNTRTVCRKCYIHPEVIEAYLDGSLSTALGPVEESEKSGFSREEATVLAFLQNRLEQKQVSSQAS